MYRYKGEIGLFAITLIWGVGFPVVDIALRFSTPYQIIAQRFFMSAALLTLIFYKSLKKLDRQNLIAGVAVGVFLFAGGLLQTVGMKYTTPSKSAFLTATYVVMVPLIDFLLFRRKIERHVAVGVVAAFAGTVILSFRPDFTVNIGDALSVLCAVAFACHVYFTGHFMNEGADPICVVIIQMITGAVLSCFMLIVTHSGNPFAFPLNAWPVVFYIGVISAALSMLIQTVSQKYVTNQSRAVVIMSMESVFGTVASVLMVGEIIGLRMVVGSAVILAGVLFSELGAGVFNKRLKTCAGKIKSNA